MGKIEEFLETLQNEFNIEFDPMENENDKRKLYCLSWPDKPQNQVLLLYADTRSNGTVDINIRWIFGIFVDPSQACEILRLNDESWKGFYAALVEKSSTDYFSLQTSFSIFSESSGREAALDFYMGGMIQLMTFHLKKLEGVQFFR